MSGVGRNKEAYLETLLEQKEYRTKKKFSKSSSNLSILSAERSRSDKDTQPSFFSFKHLYYARGDAVEKHNNNHRKK